MNERSKRMKKIARFCLSILLTAAMLLPSCDGNTPEPAEKPSDAVSQTGSETSSDIAPEEKPFRSLSAEEAEALFGKASPFDASRIENGYFYFFDTPAHPESNGSGMTAYRYNSDTGEVEYVCQKSGCTHFGDPETLESDCPLYVPVNSADQLISVLNGKVFCRSGGGLWSVLDEEGNLKFDEKGMPIIEERAYQLVWYDPQTNESRTLTIGKSDYFMFFYRGKNCFYYYKTSYDKVTDSVRGELWSVGETGGDSALVAAGGWTDDGVVGVIVPCLLNGEEVFFEFSRTDVPSGEEDSNRYRIYRIDENTGERSLFYEKSVPYYSVEVCGNAFLYADYDTEWFLTHDREDDTPMPKTLRLVDLSTGEEKILAENVTDLYNYLLTDRCAMYMLNDPSGENAFILHCYNYLTGEKTEYPLKGKRWRGYNFYYDRGQLYSLDLSLLDENGNPVRHDDLVTLVVWNIATGAQREIYKGKIVEEVK